ncbi:hypothetical protein AB0E88_12345 [Streptomyces sp. NPDC028635]|uniref:hypothetical protein n=1 Tax=Streptomyces sp. NPDC028635 TaxID=3154800 RepID=UPI0033C8AE81
MTTTVSDPGESDGTYHVRVNGGGSTFQGVDVGRLVSDSTLYIDHRAPKRRGTPFTTRAVAAGVAATVAASAGTLSAGFVALKDENKPSPLGHSDVVFVEVLLTIGVVIALAFAIPWFLTRRKYMKNQNVEFEERLRAEREYARQALEKLKQANELATLMQLNQGQITTYHDIVTDQADKSFKSSRIAMTVGMALLVAAALGGAWVPLEQIRWFIGALAAFSTLLSGYMSKTYLTLYKESIGQLNRYFDQPVLNSYYLTAERLIGDLAQEHRDEVRMQIINEVLRTSARLGGRPDKRLPQESKAAKPRRKKPSLPGQNMSTNQRSSV